MTHRSAPSAFALCLHITRRNWTVYRKDFVANISPTLADPALIMVSLGLGLGSYLSNVQGMSYMQFLAPGLTVATTLFTSFFETSYGFYVRLTFENVFKAMLTTPMGPEDVVFGEFLWVGIKGFVMAVGVAIVLAFLGFMAHPMLIPLIGVMGFLVGVACGAIGLIASALVRNINQFQTVYSFIIAPLYFLSGIFFPLKEMNPVIRWLAEIFPLIHGVRMAQAVFWAKDVGPTFLVHGGVLVLQCVILCFVALRLVRRKLVT
jgi:lipooligosaccharide transport system permease protein